MWLSPNVEKLKARGDVQGLLKVLESGNRGKADQAERALGALEPERLLALVEGFGPGRGSAALARVIARRQETSLIDALFSALVRTDEGVGSFIVEAIVSEGGAPGLESALRFLRHRHTDVVSGAARVLASNRGPQAIEALLEEGARHSTLPLPIWEALRSVVQRDARHLLPFLASQSAAVSQLAGRVVRTFAAASPDVCDALAKQLVEGLDFVTGHHILGQFDTRDLAESVRRRLSESTPSTSLRFAYELFARHYAHDSDEFQGLLRLLRPRLLDDERCIFCWQRRPLDSIVAIVPVHGTEQLAPLCPSCGKGAKEDATGPNPSVPADKIYPVLWDGAGVAGLLQSMTVVADSGRLEVGEYKDIEDHHRAVYSSECPVLQLDRVVEEIDRFWSNLATQIERSAVRQRDGFLSFSLKYVYRQGSAFPRALQVVRVSEERWKAAYRGSNHEVVG